MRRRRCPTAHPRWHGSDADQNQHQLNEAAGLGTWAGSAACRATQREITRVRWEKERLGWPNVAPSTTSAVHTRSNASSPPNEHNKRPQIHQTTAARGPPREIRRAWVTQECRARQGGHQRPAPRARGTPWHMWTCCSHDNPIQTAMSGPSLHRTVRPN